MAPKGKPFARWQIALIYLALRALIALSGCCVYVTYCLMG